MMKKKKKNLFATDGSIDRFLLKWNLCELLMRTTADMM